MIDKKEFAGNVMRLGVKARREELDELFDSLDTDHGGELTSDEIKEAFKTLQEGAIGASERIKELRKSNAAMQKAARLAQTEMAEVRRADEVEEQKKAQRLVEEEQERLALHAAEQAAKDELAQAKKAAAAEAKAAFDAKIAARRK